MLKRLLCLLLITSLVTGPAPVWGQSSAVRMDALGQARDAVAGTARGVLWVAVYDADEIWAIAPETGERVERINVGDGPVALARRADGSVIAVANSLANTVSIIDPVAGRVQQTVAVGAAPAAIAALPDNTFLVANTFSGSLTHIRPDGTATEITDIALAPIGLAVSRGTVALVSRGEKAVQFLDTKGLQSGAPVSLPFTPRAVAALPDGHFVVAGAEGVAVVDAGRASVVADTPLGARSVAVLKGEIVALTDDAVVTLNASLGETDRQPLGEAAERLAATSSLLVALAPRSRTLTIYGSPEAWQQEVAAAPAAPAAPVPPAPTPEPEDTPAPASAPEPAPEPAQTESVEPEAMGGPLVVAEAQDLPEEDSSPERPVEEETVTPVAEEGSVTPEAVTPEPEAAPSAQPETAEAKDMPAPLPEPEPVEVDSPEPEATPTTSGAATVEANPAPAAETATAPPGGFRRYPLQFQGVRAPRVGLRGPVSPIPGKNELTIMDALARPTEFAAPEFGFVMPDWEEPFRDIEADIMDRNLASGDMDFSGDVKLRLGDMLFESQNFKYRPEEGLIHASGSVNVSQMQSTITADGFDYRLRAPEEMPPPTLLDANLDEQARAKQRLTLGHVSADNIHIMEPTRELIAEHIDYDLLTNEGELINARGKAGIYYFFAERLVVTGPSSFFGEEVWITTCECSEDDPPPYRLRMKNVEIVDGELIGANHARLQIKNFNTPLYFPVWRRGGNKIYPWTVDFDSGRRAEVGYFLNVGQQYQVNPDLYIGPRLYVTEKEGVGFGIDVDYNYMETPASRLFRSKGSIDSLYTTKERGYVHWYHRYQHSEDLVLRMQAEHWDDKDFYRDFYYDKFRNRTTPRTFANVTYRQPGYVATGTARVDTHGWVRETERLPEGTFHLLERPLGSGFYFTYDNITGYNDREPRGPFGARVINLARLTYDLDLSDAFSITPYAELEASWYSRERDNDSSETRLSANFGVTAQTRFHKVYPGRFGFSSIKHLVVPSITYSYRPKTNLDLNETPIFDSWDNVSGQSRLETKLANVFFGRDAETGETWQLGRITLYQGNDFWNEQRKSEDYEIEVDIRPRPWWGFQLVGERHVIEDDLDINDNNFLEQWLAERLDRWFNWRPDNDFFDFNARYGDYNRVLTQLYYDNTPLGGRWNTRLGFAYTETQSRVFNREIVYGAGYRFSDRWSFAFEHRYDFEDDTLRTQQYEIRRIWDCWESAVRFRDRESGFDVDVEFSITAFPGTRLKL